MSMKKTLSIILFVVFAFGAGYYLYDAYGNGPRGGEHNMPGGKLAGTTWVMESFNGMTSKVPANRLVASFNETQISGRMCNIYNGKYLSNGMMFVALDVISTKMACVGDVGTIENAFFDGLRNGFQYKIEAGKLEVVDSATSNRFGFMATTSRE